MRLLESLLWQCQLWGTKFLPHWYFLKMNISKTFLLLGHKICIYFEMFNMSLLLDPAVSRCLAPFYRGPHKMAAMLDIHRAWALFSLERMSQPDSWGYANQHCALLDSGRQTFFYPSGSVLVFASFFQVSTMKYLAGWESFSWMTSGTSRQEERQSNLLCKVGDVDGWKAKLLRRRKLFFYRMQSLHPTFE